MNTPHQQEERRFALRMALRLPIVVSGRSEDGAAWSEPTETDDISTSGALFHLNQKVSIGEKLYIRAHRPDGSATETTATVVRLFRLFTALRASACKSPNQRKAGRVCLFPGSPTNKPRCPVRAPPRPESSLIHTRLQPGDRTPLRRFHAAVSTASPFPAFGTPVKGASSPG